MKLTNKELIEDLKARTNANIAIAEELKKLVNKKRKLPNCMRENLSKFKKSK